MITAKVIADSKNIFGDRITSMVVQFPRFILAEFNTHRLFSRNSASSRAVPFKKMLERVTNEPFIPIAWQKEHTGMQGTEYFTHPEDIERLRKNWLLSRDFAVQEATVLDSFKVTKQIVNRLLEPFMWHTVIVTATEWENFFDLRSPIYKVGNINNTSPNPTIHTFRSKAEVGEMFPNILATLTDKDWLKENKGQAEVHMMALAEAMWDAYRTSNPKELQPEEWHIPFGDVMDEDRIAETLYKLNGESFLVNSSHINQAKIEIATARCARVSYLNYEGKDDYEADLRLFEQLKDSRHASPFEHCAISMSESDMDNYIVIEDGVTIPGRCRNFTGFIQLRQMVENL